MDLLQSYPWPGNMRELQRVMERFVSLYEAESCSVAAKCIPRESLSARTSTRSVSGELVPDEKELLEAALMQMLAELPGSESGIIWDGGSIGEKREYVNGEVRRGNRAGMTCL
jgi:transcriptional regulator with PAS, ATPase and Fis domain